MTDRIGTGTTGPLRAGTGPIAKAEAPAKPEGPRQRATINTGDLRQVQADGHPDKAVGSVDIEHIDLGHPGPGVQPKKHDEHGGMAENVHLAQESAHQSTSVLKEGLRGVAKAAARAGAGVQEIAETAHPPARTLGQRAAVAFHQLEHNPRFSAAEKSIGVAGIAAAGYELVGALRERPMDTGKVIKELGHMAVSAELLKDVKFLAKIPGLQAALSRLGGVGAVVSGVLEFKETMEKAHKEGWSAEKIASAVSAGASALAGVFQFAALIPTPLSPVLEGLAGGCYLLSAGAALTSTAIKHKEEIAGFVKNHAAEIAFPPLGVARVAYEHRAEIAKVATAAKDAVASTWNKATSALGGVEAQATSYFKSLVGMPAWAR